MHLLETGAGGEETNGKEYSVDKFWTHLEVKLPLKNHSLILPFLGENRS